MGALLGELAPEIASAPLGETWSLLDAFGSSRSVRRDICNSAHTPTLTTPQNTIITRAISSQLVHPTALLRSCHITAGHLHRDQDAAGTQLNR
jgi:hypothetical protein